MNTYNMICVRLKIYFFRNGNKLMWWIVVTEGCRPRILRVSTSCYSTVIHFCPGNSHGTYSVFLSAFESSQKPCERIHLVLISPNPSLRLRETDAPLNTAPLPPTCAFLSDVSVAVHTATHLHNIKRLGKRRVVDERRVTPSPLH